MFHQFQLLLEGNGANLEFHTMEALFEFGLDALQHLFIVAHPHQSVDGDALFATGKGGVEDHVSMLTVEPSGLQPEEHGGIGAHQLIVDDALLLEAVAEGTQGLLVFGNGITAQVGKRGTLAHPAALRVGCRTEA